MTQFAPLHLTYLSHLKQCAQGASYWRMERNLSAAMLRHIPTPGAATPPDFGLPDVLAAHEAKSFDYRARPHMLCGAVKGL